jgi:hypothetical protein
MANIVAVPQKIKNWTTIWFFNPTPGCTSKRNERNVEETSSQLLVTVDNNGNNTSVHKESVVLIYKWTVFSYKKYEILSFLTTLMELKITMPSEIRQA